MAIPKSVRTAIRRRSRGMCEKCRKFNARHFHHLTYERRGHELPEDIEHVCLTCHGIYHPNHTFLCYQDQRKIAAARRKKRREIRKKLNIPTKPVLTKFDKARAEWEKKFAAASGTSSIVDNRSEAERALFLTVD